MWGDCKWPSKRRGLDKGRDRKEVARFRVFLEGKAIVFGMEYMSSAWAKEKYYEKHGFWG